MDHEPEFAPPIKAVDPIMSPVMPAPPPIGVVTAVPAQPALTPTIPALTPLDTIEFVRGSKHYRAVFYTGASGIELDLQKLSNGSWVKSLSRMRGSLLSAYIMHKAFSGGVPGFITTAPKNADPTGAATVTTPPGALTPYMTSPVTEEDPSDADEEGDEDDD